MTTGVPDWMMTMHQLHRASWRARRQELEDFIMGKKPRPPEATPTHCTSCGTRFQKYWDIDDDTGERCRIHYWCNQCDGNPGIKGHKK